MAKTDFKSIDEYIKNAPLQAQPKLKQIREIIIKMVPEATETISYQIPTYKINGKYLVYFAGFKQHVSMYPVPQGDEGFNNELKKYQTGKGTVRFSLDKPLPINFIKKFVKFRLKYT